MNSEKGKNNIVDAEMIDNTTGDEEKAELSRTRNWATIVYPESAPENWLKILEDLHVPTLVSPLHDSDTKADGSIEKPHYHVLLLFGSVKSRRQVQELVKTFGGVGAEYVNSLSAYARYLIHLDTPEKAQYDATDVAAFNGADFEAVSRVPTDDLNDVRDMIKYIRENEITSFAKFSDLCAFNNENWLRLLTQKRMSFFFRDYIHSLDWELHQDI